MTNPAPGTILWHDLTVTDAPRVRDFYAAVLGWTHTAQDMGGYEDYNMLAPDAEGACVAGICHARGANANIPPQWLMYVAVRDVAAAVERCLALGGSVVNGPRRMGEHTFCVLRDPAGACIAIFG